MKKLCRDHNISFNDYCPLCRKESTMTDHTPTPRTDALIESDKRELQRLPDAAWVDLARTLERELAEALDALGTLLQDERNHTQAFQVWERLKFGRNSK